MAKNGIWEGGGRGEGGVSKNVEIEKKYTSEK